MSDGVVSPDLPKANPVKPLIPKGIAISSEPGVSAERTERGRINEYLEVGVRSRLLEQVHFLEEALDPHNKSPEFQSIKQTGRFHRDVLVWLETYLYDLDFNLDESKHFSERLGKVGMSMQTLEKLGSARQALGSARVLDPADAIALEVLCAISRRVNQDYGMEKKGVRNPKQMERTLYPFKDGTYVFDLSNVPDMSFSEDDIFEAVKSGRMLIFRPQVLTALSKYHQWDDGYPTQIGFPQLARMFDWDKDYQYKIRRGKNSQHHFKNYVKDGVFYNEVAYYLNNPRFLPEGADSVLSAWSMVPVHPIVLAKDSKSLFNRHETIIPNSLGNTTDHNAIIKDIEKEVLDTLTRYDKSTVDTAYPFRLKGESSRLRTLTEAFWDGMMINIFCAPGNLDLSSLKRDDIQVELVAAELDRRMSRGDFVISWNKNDEVSINQQWGGTDDWFVRSDEFVIYPVR